MTRLTFLNVPGIGNSGPEHWQTRWERGQPNFVRLTQYDWDNPVRVEWVAVLDDTIKRLGGPVVLVAHSLGCLAVAHWACGNGLEPTSSVCVAGALLVAVPDPAGANFPPQATGFAPVPRARLSFPSIVVASSNDPYGTLGYAEACAADWGSRLVTIGAAGHINADSGLGDWPAGFDVLMRLSG